MRELRLLRIDHPAVVALCGSLPIPPTVARNELLRSPTTVANQKTQPSESQRAIGFSWSIRKSKGLSGGRLLLPV